jgi:hypothetical protein
MNASQVHLMLNHVPVLGVVFVMVALAAGLWLRRGTLLRFGLFTLVAIALAAIPVYFSGGESEETVEKLAGVQERTIEQHEDVARSASIGLAILGLIGLAGLVRYRNAPIPAPFAATVLAAAVVLGGALAWTAHLGGQIRHDEMRGVTSAAIVPAESHPEVDDD